MDKLIGTGQYRAYESHFACMDNRESFWRLSKITLSTTKVGEMTFTYVGEFASQTDIERYLRDIPQETDISPKSYDDYGYERYPTDSDGRCMCNFCTKPYRSIID
jgi:hypothetical protein